MRYNNLKLRLGRRPKVRRFIKRARKIVPYGRELPTGGVKS